MAEVGEMERVANADKIRMCQRIHRYGPVVSGGLYGVGLLCFHRAYAAQGFMGTMAFAVLGGGVVGAPVGLGRPSGGAALVSHKFLWRAMVREVEKTFVRARIG